MIALQRTALFVCCALALVIFGFDMGYIEKGPFKPEDRAEMVLPYVAAAKKSREKEAAQYRQKEGEILSKSST